MDILARLRGIGLAPVLLAMATFGWGTNAVASRLAVGEVSPMMLIFLRWGVLVILIPLLRWKEMVKAWPLVRPKLLWVFLMGGCGLSFFNALFYLAAHTTTALNIGLMQGTMPGFIVIGSFFSVWCGNQSAQGGWHIVEFLRGCDHRFQRVTGKPVEFGIYQRGSADAFGLYFLFQLCGWLAA